MSFKDYSSNPAANTVLGEGTFIGPNMPRDDVRPALQQLAADGKDLADTTVPAGNASSRAGKFLTWGPDGKAIAASGPGTDAALRTDLASPEGAVFTGFTQAVTAAATRTVQDKLRERRTILDYLGGVADGLSDNSAAFQAAANDGGCYVPAQAGGEYVIASQIDVPAGASFIFEEGVSIHYTGAAVGDINNPEGIFRATGSGIFFGTEGAGRFTIRSTTERRFLYAFFSRGLHSDHRIVGLMAHNCAQFMATSAPGVPYSGITTRARGHRVIGGGAKFDTAASHDQVHGACYFGFCDYWSLDGAEYRNTAQGVMWWGGNSAFAVDGAIANERKCTFGRVTNVDVYTTAGGGIWGSMGRDIEVENCRVWDAGDVGCDAEGSINITFRGCIVRNAGNGCFTTFNLNQGIVFEACRGYQDDPSKALFGIYNNTQQPDNRDITVRNGHFECTGNGVAKFGNQFGPARDIVVEGNTFINTRVLLADNNNHRITVRSNDFTFLKAASAAFNAIEAGGAHNIGGSAPRIVINGNLITSEVEQPAGSRLIYVTSDEANTFAFSQIAQNTGYVPVPSGFAGIRATWTGANAGVPGRYLIQGNQLDGLIETQDAGAGTPSFVVQQNYNQIGTEISATPV